MMRRKSSRETSYSVHLLLSELLFGLLIVLPESHYIVLRILEQGEPAHPGDSSFIQHYLAARETAFSREPLTESTET